MATFRPLEKPLGRPIRLGVLISGSGTTLGNFTDRINAGLLNAEVSIVIASKEGCGGIIRAENAGLRVEVVSRTKFANSEDFSKEIFTRLREATVDLVTLAGFLQLIQVPDDFRYRVMNIHPALIPAFCGKGYHGHYVHEAVLERGAKVSGCTVHFADNEYDHGPIIAQRTVPVLDDDTPDSLAARVFEAECEAYPDAIQQFASGRLEIQGQRVRLSS
ncbi:MAG: phosphoribosylglycinamide formyltransferase [Planctomycetaceae bacterium]